MSRASRWALLLLAASPTACFRLQPQHHAQPHHAARRAARPPHATVADTPSLTERLMQTLPSEDETGGAGGQGTYRSLLAVNAAWEKLKAGEVQAPRQIVSPGAATPETAEFDVIVVGGNIGILIATALAVSGLRVAVVEAGALRGRAQDWNASRKEVMELVEAGVLTKEEAEEVIGIEFNPVRCGFAGGEDVWLTDVLNVGVRPQVLIGHARARLEAHGGRVFENAPLTEVAVGAASAVVRTATGDELSTRLVLDCMGQRSPIVAQARDGALPDGACVVVGSCADGFAPEANTFGDVIFADTAMELVGGGSGAGGASSACPVQYFWEAFPASVSPTQRTTYLFTYMSLEKERPAVLDIMDDYWRKLPAYQGVDLDDLALQRVLFGLFVSYKESPLPCRWDRIMQVGDASGIQSPLSFGGFGAVTRHINRLTPAIGAALAADALSAQQLSLVNPYQANLRAAWLFQASMRPPVRAGAWSDEFISNVLVATFEVMEARGEAVMRPFLQDVLRVDGLVATIGGLMVSHPLIAVEILLRLGPLPLADWFLHFAAMVGATAVAGAPPLRAAVASAARSGALSPATGFAAERVVEGLQYGAGLDYVPSPATPLDAEALRLAKQAAAAARAYSSARAPALAAP